MVAFGSALAFVFVFGFVSLVPTGLVLHRLRRLRTFWIAFSIASLAVAAMVPAAVSSPGLS